jgi:hypothetical protein
MEPWRSVSDDVAPCTRPSFAVVRRSFVFVAIVSTIGCAERVAPDRSDDRAMSRAVESVASAIQTSRGPVPLEEITLENGYATWFNRNELPNTQSHIRGKLEVRIHEHWVRVAKDEKVWWVPRERFYYAGEELH